MAKLSAASADASPAKVVAMNAAGTASANNRDVLDFLLRRISPPDFSLLCSRRSDEAALAKRLGKVIVGERHASVKEQCSITDAAVVRLRRAPCFLTAFTIRL